MPDPKFKRGHPKKGGRKKGTSNKVSKNIKDNFEAVFEKLGGVKGFCDWAKENRQTKGAFYQMYSKMLPSNVTVDGDLNVVYQVSDKFLPKTGNENAKK
ncbi:hypothetical protein KAT51_04110 [bacterium]|nr:hypothetical protein [bacterium]